MSSWMNNNWFQKFSINEWNFELLKYQHDYCDKLFHQNTKLNYLEQ